MRRSLAVFAVTTALLAAPAGRPVLLDRIWSVLSAIWSGPSTDAGCGADPYGRCTPVVQPEEGCGADPYGRCTTAAQPAVDAGCGFDPNGCPKGS
jgi:hypothetical protein